MLAETQKLFEKVQVHNKNTDTNKHNQWTDYFKAHWVSKLGIPK